MNNLKRLLISVCMISTLAYQSPPPAKAQAAAGLGQMATGLAVQLIPMVLPVVMTVAVMGVRAGLQAPGMIKEKMSSLSMPKFGRGKNAEEQTAEAPAEGAAGEGESIEAAENTPAPRPVAEASVSATVRINKQKPSEEAESDERPREEAPQGNPAIFGSPTPSEGSDWYQ